MPKELTLQLNGKLPGAMDEFHVMGERFLGFLDTTIKHRNTEHLTDNRDVVKYEAIDKIFDFYNNHGYEITSIRCDRAFKTLLDPVKNDIGVTLDQGPAQTHCSPAERNIRTLKERIRATVHSVPFLAIPKVMIVGLVIGITEKLNLFPAKEGISRIYSPRQIITGRCIHFKQLGFPFGAYVVGNHEPTNKNSM